MFCAYLTHHGYGWGEFCERTFGDVPSQICFEWNTPRHTTDDAVPCARRSFSKAELQHLFDHVDDVVDREFAIGSKRWLRSAGLDRLQGLLRLRFAPARAHDARPR